MKEKYFTSFRHRPEGHLRFLNKLLSIHIGMGKALFFIFVKQNGIIIMELLYRL